MPTRYSVALLALLLPAAALAQNKAETATRHLDALASARGVAAEISVTEAIESRSTGATHVYLRQTIDGIGIVGTEATVVVDRSGAVRHAAGADRLTAAAASASKAGPALTASDAASALARHNRLGSGSFAPLAQKASADREQTLSDGGIADGDVPARLVYHPSVIGELRLAWEVMIYQRDGAHAWLGYVDAQTGAVLRQTDLVVHDTFGPTPEAAVSFAPLRQEQASMASAMVGSYTVYAMPLDSPYDGGRTAVANPDDATASPFGWHDTNGAVGAEYTITRGNNVHAYTDTDANNSPDAGSSPDGGGTLTFNFPVNLSNAPSSYRPASVTNLFYWNNVVHDVLHRHGFDEPFGNFQVNNYGRGGAGNDDVRAEAQDGGGTNNANFFTPSDGSRPRMQMYIGTSPNPDVDGSFDNGVVVHEYGHGISNRLTGGPAAAGCLGNAEQMGEGWSDIYGLMFTMTAADSGPDARGIGNYLFGYGPNGGGIRLAPYSTNFAVNSYTYGDTRGMRAVHQIGFVWATVLWEAMWEMVDAHGFDADLYNANGTAGNQIMFRLVTEGMKYQPCSPGFVSGRDGILAAEQAIYGGQYAATLQAAFARRGLGYSATEGSTNRNRDNREAFDLWPGGGGNNAPNAAFTASCTALSCSFTDASSDSDGSIASRSWTFGDGASSGATNPSHTYGADGSYTVTLTVTDNDGATDSASQTVSVSAGGTGGDPITLSVSTRQQGPWTWADLSWTNADGGNATIFVDGSSTGSTVDDGSESIRIGRNPSGSDTFQVCDNEDSVCSNTVTVNYFAGLTGGAGEIDTSVSTFPNPLRDQTTIRFGLAEEGEVDLVVYNSVGQQVAVLASGHHASGRHEAAFDATALPAGVYVYRLTTGAEVQTGRLSVVR